MRSVLSWSDARAATRWRHSDVVRARIVLFAADGFANVDIAEELSVHVDVVSRWRKRFCEEGLAGLDDRPRSGHPRRFGPEVVAEVKAMACEAPALVEMCRCRGGARRSWPRRQSAKGWRRRCRRRRCAAGWPRMRSSRGSTSRGSSLATRTSPPKQPGCSTCMAASGTVGSWARTTTSSAPTRSPSCRRCRVVIPAWPAAPAERPGWSSNTTRTAPSPTSAPTTSTTPA